MKIVDKNLVTAYTKKSKTAKFRIPHLSRPYRSLVFAAITLFVFTMGTVTAVVLVQNEQATKVFAGDICCNGGICAGGATYGPDEHAPQETCAQRTADFCNAAGRGGPGTGGGDCGGGGGPAPSPISGSYCAICSPANACECVRGLTAGSLIYNNFKCQYAPSECSNLGYTWQPDRTGICPAHGTDCSGSGGGSSGGGICCEGGTCANGDTYGEDGNAPQSTCAQRAAEFCNAAGRGGPGTGGGDCGTGSGGGGSATCGGLPSCTVSGADEYDGTSAECGLPCGSATGANPSFTQKCYNAGSAANIPNYLFSCEAPGGGGSGSICSSSPPTSQGCYNVPVGSDCAIGGGYKCDRDYIDDSGKAVCACRLLDGTGGTPPSTGNACENAGKQCLGFYDCFVANNGTNVSSLDASCGSSLLFCCDTGSSTNTCTGAGFTCSGLEEPHTYGTCGAENVAWEYNSSCPAGVCCKVASGSGDPYEDCIASGNTPTECSSTVPSGTPPTDPYEDCIASGNTPTECSTNTIPGACPSAAPCRPSNLCGDGNSTPVDTPPDACGFSEICCATLLGDVDGSGKLDLNDQRITVQYCEDAHLLDPSAYTTSGRCTILYTEFIVSWLDVYSP